MRLTAFLSGAASLMALLAAAATAHAQGVKEPLRPEPKTLPPVVEKQDRVPVKEQPLPQSPEDCEPVMPNQGPPAKKYRELDIPAGAAQASEGLKILIESEKNIPPEDVAGKIESAVAKFFGALSADPYNVNATYNLAAAYARIGRNQCAVNLLYRLAAMKGFHSRKKAIDQKRDRFLGQGSRWKGKPDPDFSALRSKPEFEGKSF
jgi:hypothetical protein